MSAPGLERVVLQCPPGMSSGQMIQFKNSQGQVFSAAIPPGVQPGGSFAVEIPVAVAAAVAAPTQPPPPQSSSVPMGLPMDQPGSRPAVSFADGGIYSAHQQQGGGAYPGAAPNLTQKTPLKRTATNFHAPVNSTAVKHAECPICFEPLHKAPCGVFLDARGLRVSPHFYNLHAAQTWLGTGNTTCPLTRAPVASVLPVPDIRTDPHGWFRAVDIDGDGRLSRKEVVECLKAQLPVDNAALDAAAADASHWMWAQWDTDRSGYIEAQELFHPQGLLAYVTASFGAGGARAIPDITRDKEAWYRYWDEDGSNSLEKEEVVRALIKTLKMSSDPAQVQMMRGTIDAIWCIFDDDGSGSIEKNEFLRGGDGLADTIIATVRAG